MPTFQEIMPTFKELPIEAPSAATGPGPVPTHPIRAYDRSRTYEEGDIVRGEDGNFYSCVKPALARNGLGGGGWACVCIDPPPSAAAGEDSVRNPYEDLDDDAMQLAHAFASRSSGSGGTLHGRVMDLLDDAYKTIDPIGGWGRI